MEFLISKHFVSPGINQAEYQCTSVATKLLGAIIYNASTNDSFFQIHDAAAIPADGCHPVVSVLIPNSSSVSIDLANFQALFLSNGLYWCNSSTQPTKTLSTANFFVTLFYFD